MFRKFVRDVQGQFAVAFAAASVAVVMAAATAVDYGEALRAHKDAQNSLDAAILFGATQASDPDKSETQIKESVKEFFISNLDKNELVATAIYVEVDRVNNSVSAKLSYEDDLIFGGILVPGIRTGRVDATAVYSSEPESDLCVLALHEKAANTIMIDGSADVDAPDCSFMANSPTVAQAVYFKGSGKTVGKSFCAVGDHTTNGSRTVTPPPQDFCTPVLDPFADWTPPKAGPCDYRNKREFVIRTTSEVRLNPGHYCVQLDIQASRIVLEPGYYFFSDDVIFNASDQVFGGGVYLQFTKDSTELSITGGASIKLTKLNDKKLRDILFYIDPASTISPGLKLTGNADISLLGAIYAPGHDVYMTGRTSLYGNGVQTAIVASKIYLSGNNYFVIKPLTGMDSSPGSEVVRLVE